MINVHIKDLMVGTKSSSTNAIGCFLQAITNLVGIFSEAVRKFFKVVTCFYLVSHFMS